MNLHHLDDAAYSLGRDGVLNDPTDDEIVLAAVELVRGHWPEGLSFDRYYISKLVAAYDKGYDAFVEHGSTQI